MKAVAAAYIAGVVAGDGWLTEKALGLAANDIEFVTAFRDAVRTVFDVDGTIRADAKRWRVAYRNESSRFSGISGAMTHATTDQWCAWLRGLFDGDGNAQCLKLKRGEASYQRRIAIYKANLGIVATAEKALASLGIATVRSVRKATTGHHGKLPVIELRVRSREDMRRFVELIGSTIPRKQETLERIVATMQPAGWQAENLKRARAARWANAEAAQ